LAGRQVDVFVNGQPTVLLTFGKGGNRTTVSLSPVHAKDDSGTLTIEFRPRTIAIPKDVDHATEDVRQLGVALHGIRIRSIGMP
jgi:hypothetical protein